MTPTYFGWGGQYLIFEASIVVISTVTKDVDSNGKVCIRAKEGAKTDSGTSRGVPPT